MLSVFSFKPAFDADKLKDVLATWPAASAPRRFLGKPKKDIPIDEWLDLIATAAKAQGVPQTFWHEVARYFMSDKAKARVGELELVMQHVYGQKWGWKWATFGAALKNMGWDIDSRKMKVIEVTSNIWAAVTRSLGQGARDDNPTTSSGSKVTSKNTTTTIDRKVAPKLTKQSEGTRPALPKRAATVPVPQKADKSDGHTVMRTLTRLAAPLHLAAPPQPFIAQVPLWLLAASEAIAVLMNDYPTTMSIIAAVLITVGSIPALPVVSAGSTVQAAGSIAVGLGTLLRERAHMIDKK